MPYRLLISEESVQAYVTALVKSCFHNAQLCLQNENAQSNKLTLMLTAFLPQMSQQSLQAINLHLQQSVEQLEITRTEYESTQQVLWEQLTAIQRRKPLVCLPGEIAANERLVLNQELEVKQQQYNDIIYKSTFLDYLLTALTEVQTLLQTQIEAGLSPKGEYFEFSEAYLKHFNEMFQGMENEVDSFFGSFVLFNAHSRASSSGSSSSTSSAFAQRLVVLRNKMRQVEEGTIDNSEQHASSATYVPRYNAQESASSSSTADFKLAYAARPRSQ